MNLSIFFQFYASIFTDVITQFYGHRHIIQNNPKLPIKLPKLTTSVISLVNWRFESFFDRPFATKFLVAYMHYSVPSFCTISQRLSKPGY